MERCPHCGGTEFEVETVNQVEVKKCRTCGAYVEDAGREFPWNSFVPQCERDESGRYPFCPKCGCREVRRLSVEGRMVRSNLLAALIAGEPYERQAMGRQYECQNPKCRYRWD